MLISCVPGRLFSNSGVGRANVDAKPDPAVSGSFRFIVVPERGLPNTDAWPGACLHGAIRIRPNWTGRDLQSRSTTAGATRVARRAGIKHATTATSTSTAVAATNVGTSNALTP